MIMLVMIRKFFEITEYTDIKNSLIPCREQGVFIFSYYRVS